MTESTEHTRADPRTWAIIIWGSYLASYLAILYLIFWFVAVIGLIIAYVKRNDLDDTPYESHVTSAIRTFWIGLLASIVGWLLLSERYFHAFYGLVIISFIWCLFRDVRGFIFAIDGREIKNSYRFVVKPNLPFFPRGL